MVDDNDFLQEIQGDFLQETSGLLDNTEHCYLELEKKPSDISIMEEIFRCVHTIKGGASAVGFNDLSSFAHQIENLLIKLKNNEIPVDSHIVNVLLDCNDKLVSFIETLKEDAGSTKDTGELEGIINNLINSPPPDKKDNNSYKELNQDFDLDEKPKRIGEILIEEGIVKQEQLDMALKKQEKSKRAFEKKEDNSIRLPLSKIDSMLDSFGEQVILQSALEFARQDIQKNKELIDRTIIQLNKIVYDLQQTALSLRMVSLKNLFIRCQRIVRDVSAKIGKEVDFKTYGEDTELDKSIIDELAALLTHLLRNAVDHGIEVPETREKIGKPAKGTVILNAYHQGGFFYLEVKDDGKGIDREKVYKRGIELGLINKGAAADNKINSLIFESGFSTKESATDISGRGVGMDVVKAAINKLHGGIHFTSAKDKGSAFVIKLPLTLSIFNGTVFGIASKRYILPNSEINEICNINIKNTRKINSKETVIKIKDDVIPLIDLKMLLSHSGDNKTKRDKAIVMIVSNQNKRYAFLVDELIEQQRVVLKNLGKEIKNVEGIAGGTILGDGKVALILETNELIGLYQNMS